MKNPAIMAGIGLGNMTCNLIVLNVLLKIILSLQSVLPQAYGSGNIELCGVFLNRCRFLVTIIYIPLLLLIFNIKFLYMDLN